MNRCWNWWMVSYQSALTRWNTARQQWRPCLEIRLWKYSFNMFCGREASKLVIYGGWNNRFLVTSIFTKTCNGFRKKKNAKQDETESQILQEWETHLNILQKTAALPTTYYFRRYLRKIKAFNVFVWVKGSKMMSYRPTLVTEIFSRSKATVTVLNQS